MNKKRVDYIDVAKGIATILVILGHLSVTPKIFVIELYTFHIPLFFMLSGYVLNLDKFKTLRIFIADKTKKILIPYSVLAFVTWVCIYCIRQFPYELTKQSLQSFIGIFICAKDTPYYLTLWFVVSLFFAQVLLYVLVKSSNTKYIIIKLLVCFVLGYGISLIYHPGWLWALDTVPMATFFVGCGYLLKKYQGSITQIYQVKFLIPLIPLQISIGYFNYQLFGRQDLFYQNLGNPLLYVLAAFFGIWIVLIISRVFHKDTVLQYIGMNSLVFYAFHRPVFVPIVMKWIDDLKGIHPEIFSNRIVQTFICLLVICVGCAILSEIINRFFPFIIGKKGESKKS